MTQPALKLAVIGDPVEHSKSPLLHRGFMREAGLAGTYEAICVKLNETEEALGRLAAAGYQGVNVTTPLKEAALACAGEVDAIAQAIGGANTLTYDRKKNSWRATNTDGIGAIYAIEETLGTPVAGRRILVLGTGATGRAAVHALTAAGARVELWNRSPDRAVGLAEAYDIACWAPQSPAFAAIFSSLPPDAAIPETILEVLQATEYVVDANYGSRSTLGTVLEKNVITGEAMLAAQARASFDIWCAALGIQKTIDAG